MTPIRDLGNFKVVLPVKNFRKSVSSAARQPEGFERPNFGAHVRCYFWPKQPYAH